MLKSGWIFVSGLLLSALFIQNARADKIYKCKNQKGILIYGSSPCSAGAEAISDWTVTPKSKRPEILNLSQGNGGHYQVSGKVNEQSLMFVVDTGASFVSIPDSIANAAQLSCMEQTTIQTANGSSQACRTVISKFKFGPFELHDVDALIAPNLGQALLGMNVLQKYKIAQDRNGMHISEH